MRSSKLEKQRRVASREVALRAKLQASYDEQTILVHQQQALLAELDLLSQELMHVAFTDALTGLPNYRAVMSRLDEAIAHCQRTRGSCAVLLVDLNRFKRVNDTWGHRAGDWLLREIAQRLHTSIRAEDFVGRYGGEEFVILLPEGDRQTACETAEYLCSVIASPPYSLPLNDGSSALPISITASIGVAIYPLHGRSSEALLESADRAMYQAKYTGGGACLADGELISTRDISSHQDEKKHTVEVMAVQVLRATHDREAKAHAQRIAQLAQAVAHKLNRPEEEIHLVYLAALLRAIGKLDLPGAMPHKLGPLTEEEWSIMRHHPAIGCHILALLISSVLAQHERWDGYGYPHRLTQEEIPLSARILAVVDSYDVMTTPRPYRRDPLSLSKAKTALQRGAGSRYDPQVVEAFLLVLAEQENQPVPLGAAEVLGTSDVPTSTIRVSTDHLWQQQQQRLAWQKQKLEQQTLFAAAKSEQSCYFKRSIVPVIPQSGKNTSKNKPTALNTLA